jgi:hypothetical protein
MDENPLVENEGVNAGSAEQIEDSGAAPAWDVGRPPQNSVEVDQGIEVDQGPDVRGGGDPQDVDPKAPVDDLDPGSASGDSRLLGAPSDDDRYPGRGPGSAGQDAGSME